MTSFFGQQGRRGGSSMLTHFFQAPARIHEIRSNPSAALIEGFADYLFGARTNSSPPRQGVLLCGEKSV
jgi:hypothetical protein